MVQQLSLVSTIYKDEFNLIVNAIIALTGQKPRALLNENILFRPIINLKLLQAQQSFNTSVNLSQLEQYFVKISCSWQMYADKNPNVVVNEILDNDNEKFMEKVSKKEISMGEVSADNQAVKDYSFSISDISAAGKRVVSSQTIYESYLRHSPDSLRSYLKNLGYQEKSRYLVKGLRFLYNQSINIEIFQVFFVEDGKIRIIDPTENWFFKAYINVAKITDIAGINKGSAELVEFQKGLENLVKLKIPDRNCMDARERG